MQKYLVNRKVYKADDNKLITNSDLKLGNEDEMIKYFNMLKSAARTKADYNNTLKGPHFTIWTKNKFSTIIFGNTYVFELKKTSKIKLKN